MGGAQAGRPRKFDYDAALDQALKVFWSKGYEAASLADLTEAMGINRPSLYASFGDKESLFRKAAQRYTSLQHEYVTKALSEPIVKKAIEKLLDGTINAMTSAETPHGCLLVHGALVGGSSLSTLRTEAGALRKKGEDAIRKRLERARTEGDLPANASPRALAKYLATVINGLAVQAAGGASRSKLRQVKDWVMLTWPR